MIGPVLSVDRSAIRATFTRVLRIDENYRDASALRLVGDELAKLGKGPITQACSLSTAGLYPVADIGQFLKTNGATGALRGFNKLLRNAVVSVFLEPRLFAREFSEAALSRLRSSFLKTRTAAVKIGAYLFDGLASVALAVAVGRNVGNTEVDAQGFQRVDQLRIVNVADTGEIEAAPDKQQINLALTEGEHVALMLAHRGLDLDSAVQRPDRNDVVGLEADNPVIVRLRRVLAELYKPVAAVGLLCRVSVGNLGNAADGRLSAKRESLSRLGVPNLVQVKLPRHASLKAFPRQEIARLVAAFERISKLLGLLSRRKQLDIGDQFHYSSIERFELMSTWVNSLRAKARTPIPPRPEGRGISEKI